MPRTKKVHAMKTPAETTRQPKPAVERELSPIQEVLCDLTSDVLLNGARREETELLVKALLMHQWHLNFGDYPRDPAKALEAAVTHAQRGHDATYNDLVAAWPKKAVPQDEPVPKTISQAIRCQTRDSVRHGFEDFMGNASPEELILMRNIFQERDSYHYMADGNPVQEIYLAAAFESATGSWGTTHVKIPSKMVPLIEQLVAARQKIEEEEECA